MCRTGDIATKFCYLYLQIRIFMRFIVLLNVSFGSRMTEVFPIIEAYL
jgi:hypothetical protein